MSEALKCYKCTNCKEDENREIEECDDGYDVCLKMSIAGLVHKSCSKEAACSVASAEDVLRDAWNDLKSNFQDNDQDMPEARDNDANQNKFANCCSEDYCNGAETKLAATSTLIIFLTFPLLNYFL